MGSPKTKFHVASWNILIDDQPNTLTLSQHQRCDSLGDTLADIGKALDFLGLYEVEGSEKENCGRDISASLGLKQVQWAQHFRPHEGIMLASRHAVDEVNTVILDPDQAARAAIIAKQGKVTIVATHLISFVTKNNWRIKEVTSLLEKLEGMESVIILGDFNCLPSQKPRKLLESNGYTSVLGKLSPKKPSTFPTDGYRDISVKPWQNRVIPKGLSLDDIYFKNLKFIEGGLFEGNTDHHGIWASLEITT